MAFTIDQFRVDGKVAIVTGAGGRGNSIGRAYALGLAGAGAKLVVADLNPAGAEAVAQEVRDMGGEAISVGVDISQRDQVEAMAAKVREEFGGADILVNNAAMMADMNFSRIGDYPIADWDRIVAVNLTGALHCCQTIIPQMLERGGGKIVNQVSGGAFPAGTAYGITKLALTGLTTTLAADFGRRGINANAIAPGNVMTEAGKAITPESGAFRQRLDMTVAGRVMGEPDELVGALLLLCSPAGDWIHGQVLHVDGGWVVRP